SLARANLAARRVGVGGSERRRGGHGRLLTALLVSAATSVAGLPFLPAQFGGAAPAAAVVGSSGMISTFAGTGVAGFSGDGGPATSAQLSGPVGPGVATDSSGNIYITDNGNSRIRKISSNGTISTFVGNGSNSDSGDGGPATSAGLYDPADVALDQ